MRLNPFLVVGGVAAAAAPLSFFWQRAKFSRWQRATGVVLDVKKVFDGEATMHMPVVRFTPAGAGTEIEFEESTQASISRLRSGQRVEVLYDPRNPKSAILAGWRQYLAPAFLGVVAILALAGGTSY